MSLIHRVERGSGRRRGAIVALALLLAVIAPFALAAPANAAALSSSQQSTSAVTQFLPTSRMVSGSCGGGRCTVWLSKSETQQLGYGPVPPAPPASVPWQLQGAYYAAAYGHKWFAAQYANRGWCSGFRLSIYPWESQGYFGYAC